MTQQENTRGRFFALEGIDGSGKSTQLKLLAQRLQRHGLPCHRTKEPTDAPIGALIRQILSGQWQADPRAVAALFAADRIEHLVHPTDGLCDILAHGTHVITDRYYFSSYAYHSVDLDMDWVIQTNAISAELLRPNLTLFFDLPIPVALHRIRTNRPSLELYETEERLRAVRAKYFEAFEKLHTIESVCIIDANGTEAEVSERVWRAVAPFLPIDPLAT